MISALSSSTASFPSATESRQDRNRTGSRTAATQLSQAEQAQIKSLAETDRKVRTHESAHLAAAGGLSQGGASFGFKTGPDGKSYAVSGEVQISTAKGRTPEETLARAAQIRRAALAPADPSSQDHRVAAEAAQMASEAQAALMKKALASGYDSSASPRGSQVDTEA